MPQDGTSSRATAPEQQAVNRACEPCRVLKVRCLPQESSASGICQRCSRSGRNCVFAAPQKRRQRKRTDTRVAELEKEVRSMRLLLEKGGNAQSIPEESPEDEKDSDASESPGVEGTTGPDDEHIWRTGIQPLSSTDTPNDDRSSQTSYSSFPTASNKLGSNGKDVIDRGILTEETASILFDLYNNELVQHLPSVILSPTTTARSLRRSKPILFMAVITAACCGYDSTLYAPLFDETIKIYAENIFINADKSLELIQALTITSAWYCPPRDDLSGKNLQFYQYIHIAATMALDIGLGTQIDASAMTLENSRAICACYLNCAGVAMRMRRPNMLQWTSWMSQCLEFVEKSPGSTFLDQRLAGWVRLQVITDDYANFFAFDDAATTVNLSDSRMQITLKGFERQLEDWRRNVPQDVVNEMLQMAYCQNSIYLHERIAIDGNYDDKDNFNHSIFNPPQATSTATMKMGESGPLSAGYISAIMSCIHSMHELLDIFLAIDNYSMRTCPTIVYVRTSYTMVVLIKLYISTHTSAIGDVLDRNVLRVDHYLESCSEKLKIVSCSNKYRNPDKWLHILREVGAWYHRYDKILLGKGGVWTDATNYGNQALSSKDRSSLPVFVSTVSPINSTALAVCDFVGQQSVPKPTPDIPSIGPNGSGEFSEADPTLWALAGRTVSDQPSNTDAQMTEVPDLFGGDFPLDDFTFFNQPGDGFDGSMMWMMDNPTLGEINFDPTSVGWHTHVP